MTSENIPQAELEYALRRRLDASPNDFPALIQLASLLLPTGRRSEGMALLDRAATLNPGHAAPFTLKATTLFRDNFGPPPPPRTPPAGNHVVSMRQLGDNGKFGNQLLQYAFLRLYAQRHGLVALAPDWIGRDLFGLDDPFPGNPLPSVDEEKTDLFASLIGQGPVFADHDLTGYFCRHTGKWKNGATTFRALYRPAKRLEDILQRALTRLRERGKTLVGIHIRRGDFGYGPFWIAPTAWYLAWLDNIWNSLDAPVLYVASDDPGAASEFKRYGAVSADMLGVSLPGAEFYLDHYLLSQAAHLAISNSTFSFTAAMLNEAGQSFVRPDPDQRSLTAFDPWNAHPLLQPDPSRLRYSPDEESVIAKWIGPRGVAVHVGNSCSPWTSLIRKRHPQMRIVEIAEGGALDQTRRDQDLKHINHLIVEDGVELDPVITGGPDAIRHARIDVIHFKGNPSPTFQHTLEQQGYRLMMVAGGALHPLSLSDLTSPRMAVQERLLATQQGGLELEALCARHGIQVRGVIHIGAHEGRELPVYERLGAKRILFVEANPAVFARLQDAMRDKDRVITVNRAISDRTEKAQLHLTSFDQSSSLLPLQRHRAIYPQIVPAGTVTVDAVPLDALLQELQQPLDAFNLLAVDVQGAEAMVLKGASNTLARMDAVSIEVNFTDLYRGAAEIEDIEAALGAAGFRRVRLVSPYHPSWGDAFYIRKMTDQGSAKAT